MPEDTIVEISEEDLSVPASILAESFDPHYHFNWQNPTLKATIYPFRKAKLINFLAYFAEIDQVQLNKDKNENDPKIKALISRFTAEVLNSLNYRKFKLGWAHSNSINETLVARQTSSYNSLQELEASKGKENIYLKHNLGLD